MTFRDLIGTSAVGFRRQLANLASRTFGGKRDLYKALGYKREIELSDYRSRFRRNEVANRIVKALPVATWRGGVQLVEDEDPTTETEFEAAWEDLDQRLKVSEVFQRADKLAGIGRYAIILIGAPGELDQPLENAGPEEIVYLQPYCEEDATIGEFEIDVTSPRFGLPKFYNVKRTNMMSPTAINTPTIGRRVHWTRVMHVADGLLDDNIFGEPRLECVWNRLDDLEKVAGGGSEAFWKRADPGIQWDLDPTLEFGEDDGVAEKAKVQKQIDEFEHDLRRQVFTRGVKANVLDAGVADFNQQVASLMSLISAGTGIPQRVLMGSEQGKLAAKQDRANWDNRVSDRQKDFADPYVVRPFVQRLIDLGALPEPVDGFDVKWSSISVMDDEQRATIAGNWANLNSQAGETVVLPDEIREQVLGLAPLAEVADGATRIPAAGPAPAPTAASAKGGPAWKHVHQVADRFRSSRLTHHEKLVRRRQARGQSVATAAAAEGTERSGFLRRRERGN
jgi:hypothetical protein